MSLESQTRVVTDAQQVHITAQIRGLEGDPISDLRPSNFVVLGAGSTLPFSFATRDVNQPTFVLIVVAPSAGFSSLSDIKAFLSANVPNEVQTKSSFSFLGPRGESIGFRQSPAALIADIGSPRIVYRGFPQAIADLAKCRGHRAIIYLTNRMSNPPLEFVAAAKDAGALVYEVGGDPNQNYIYSGVETTGGPLSNYSETSQYGPVVPTGSSFPAVNNTVVWEGSGARSIRTVYVERSIKTAFREIKKESDGSYVLTVKIPQSVRTIELKPKIGGEYQLNAFDYADEGRVAPLLILAE
jgi:hypothetical protein